jgi:hypothetical protein
MGILSRGIVIAVLFTGASALHAFEQRTVWFNVPSSGSQPLTSDPGPISSASFGPGQGSEWLTWSADDLDRMGLPDGVGGLQLPNIGELWDTLNVPAGLRDDLVSVTLTFQYYFQVDFTFTRTATTPNGPSGATSNGTLTVYDLVAPAPAPDVFPDVESPFGQTLGVVLQNQQIVSGEVEFLAGEPTGTIKTDTGNTSFTSSPISLTGGNLTALASETPGFVALPISFLGSGGTTTGGNAAVAGVTFGGIRLAMTYTFLPESDWAWAGLPLVFGAWAVRRRMASVAQA